MNIKELLSKKLQVEQQLSETQQELMSIEIELQHLLAGQIEAMRQVQQKEFGVVSFVSEGVKVTETVPKKVEWDQDKMSQLFDAIATAGDDPRAYMKIKLEVPEKQYEAFIPDVKKMFSDCRTVRQGKPVLRFEVLSA